MKIIWKVDPEALRNKTKAPPPSGLWAKTNGWPSREVIILLLIWPPRSSTAAVSCFCCHAAQFSALGKLCQEDEGSLVLYPRSRGEKALRLSAAFTFWAGHIPRYVGQHYSKLLGKVSEASFVNKNILSKIYVFYFCALQKSFENF